MIQEVFNRYEFKYVINMNQYKQVLKALKGRIEVDGNGDPDGFYKILSLYYDSDADTFFHETIDGTTFRQKLRLRAYNHVTMEDDVFLEVKQKHNGVVNKRRTQMRVKDAYDFLKLGVDQKALQQYASSNKQILNEIHFLKEFHLLTPKILVSYDRQAFQGIEEKDLRVTFDTNLRKQEFDLRIDGANLGTQFMGSDVSVLEVKVNDRIPLWLSRTLNECGCYRQSVSKYCIGYQQSLTAANSQKKQVG
ncbi:conserved hypothetical protein [Alkaliphilus metalliredigens QYMF]|uniref:VTC domain-containing protein n=1 Tax=Alkaliphilus metalliredigens (strain QYMF) TaxID=293826 RepID=A6TK21_ALKMQ|nr:polyphosphate polymerase domain-containing protein [Alkaliphilus metalliredigens]ABR46539.1 conserved hypothetical protein [Alkaliphilus metalliredigens QYMF]